MTAAFYYSDAVLHDIPAKHREAAFEEMMRSDAYMEGYIFESEGKTAGYALLSKTYSQEAGGRVIWLEEIMLLPEFRGKGIGTEFFAFLKEKLPAARYRLEAEPENERAIALYKRQGFTELPYIQFVIDG